MPDAEATSKPRVQSAARVVDILQVVARAGGSGISASAISEKIGVPRQVVYHLAHTLTEVNMLRKVGRGSYLLGIGVGALAQGFRRQMGSSDLVSRYAERAAAATGETAYVVGWVDDEIVVLGTARGGGTIQVAEIPKGTTGDAHARASGKLLLAMASQEELSRYLEHHAFTKRTSNTITSRAALDKELKRIREEWFATDNEEYELGLTCLAVPLGEVPSTLAVGISAPTSRLLEHFDTRLKQLRKIASEVS
ncbi:MAG: IclR family transcriptional regulator [Pseudomonadota bacterium]